jgi:hypothetical protein
MKGNVFIIFSSLNNRGTISRQVRREEWKGQVACVTERFNASEVGILFSSMLLYEVLNLEKKNCVSRVCTIGKRFLITGDDDVVSAVPGTALHDSCGAVGGR